MSDRSDFLNGGSDQPYDKSYAMSGRIMLSAIVILFFVVIFMVCLHLYARWYLLRNRRRHTAGGTNRHSRRRRGGANLVFHVDAGQVQASGGLDAAVLNSLPIFVFAAAEEEEKESPIECAVCLSEFEDKETGRRLPKCGHCFHTECIDMWFRSHATCPLCRSPVEPSPSDPEVRVEIAAGAEPERTEPVIVVVVPSGSAPDSEFCSDCAAEASSAAEARSKKPASVSIEVPARSDFGDIGFGSPGSQTTPSSFRSPMSRMLSFTRILSRERRNGVVSPNTNNNNNSSASCSTVNELELDIERGKEGTQ